MKRLWLEYSLYAPYMAEVVATVVVCCSTLAMLLSLYVYAATHMYVQYTRVVFAGGHCIVSFPLSLHFDSLIIYWGDYVHSVRRRGKKWGSKRRKEGVTIAIHGIAPVYWAIPRLGRQTHEREKRERRNTHNQQKWNDRVCSTVQKAITFTTLYVVHLRLLLISESGSASGSSVCLFVVVVLYLLSRGLYMCSCGWAINSVHFYCYWSVPISIFRGSLRASAESGC